MGIQSTIQEGRLTQMHSPRKPHDRHRDELIMYTARRITNQIRFQLGMDACVSGFQPTSQQHFSTKPFSFSCYTDSFSISCNSNTNHIPVYTRLNITYIMTIKYEMITRLLLLFIFACAAATPLPPGESTHSFVESNTIQQEISAGEVQSQYKTEDISQKEEEKDQVCAICLDLIDMNQIIDSPFDCQHKLHNICFSKLYKHAMKAIEWPKCPQCRVDARIDSSIVRRLARKHGPFPQREPEGSSESVHSMRRIRRVPRVFNSVQRAFLCLCVVSVFCFPFFINQH